MSTVAATDPTAFIARWQAADGTELANYQLFVHQLADLLDVDHPQPSREDTRDNAYVFERRITLARGDGSASEGRIDCYRRGAFVLEAKKIRGGAATRGFEEALLRARAKAAATQDESEEEAPPAPKPAPAKRAPWPAALPEQIRLVADTVTLAARPLDLEQLADHFTGRGPWRKRLPDIVESLVALGRIKVERAGERDVLHG